MASRTLTTSARIAGCPRLVSPTANQRPSGRYPRSVPSRESPQGVRAARGHLLRPHAPAAVNRLRSPRELAANRREKIDDRRPTPIVADDFPGASAWATRLGVGAFLLFFGAYDTLAGIGTGLAMRSARDLPAAQQEGVWVTVKDWPGFEPAVFSINVIGTLGWVVAVGVLALVARRAGAPRIQWIFIALAALFLMAGTRRRSARSPSAACSSPRSSTSGARLARSGSRPAVEWQRRRPTRTLARPDRRAVRRLMVPTTT